MKLQTDVGVHLCELGLLPQAEACFCEALVACRGGVAQRAVLLQNLGAVLNAQRCYAAAMPFHTEAALAFSTCLFTACGGNIRLHTCLCLAVKS